VLLLLICTFLKLNNKSLSLGFPTLGFSLALPKFLSYSWLVECCSLCLFQCYQHLDNISMLVILSSKLGSTIFFDILTLTTLFFILMTFSNIF